MSHTYPQALMERTPTLNLNLNPLAKIPQELVPVRGQAMAHATSQAREESTAIATMLREHASNYDVMQSRHADCTKFLNTIFTSNIDVHDKTGKVNNPALVESMVKSSYQWLPAFPRMAPIVPRIAGQNAAGIQRILQEEHLQMAANLNDGVITALQLMRNNLVLGGIEWFPGNMARYIYFRTNVYKTLLDTRHKQGVNDVQHLGYKTRTTTDTTSSDYLFTMKKQMNYHELFETAVHWPNNVPIPERAARILQAAPEFLRPHLHVVTGQLIYKQTAEQKMAGGIVTESEVRTNTQRINDPIVEQRRPTYRRDPALILGPFPLCGWEDGER